MRLTGDASGLTGKPETCVRLDVAIRSPNHRRPHARCATHRTIVLPPRSTDAALSRARPQNSRRRPCVLAGGGRTFTRTQLFRCHAEVKPADAVGSARRSEEL